VGGFGSVLWEGFVVIKAGGDGIEVEIELVFPTEFEAGLAEGVVAVLGTGVAFGEVAGKSGRWNEAIIGFCGGCQEWGWEAMGKWGEERIGPIGLIGPIS
jgi:hypothetical protein